MNEFEIKSSLELVFCVLPIQSYLSIVLVNKEWKSILESSKRYIQAKGLLLLIEKNTFYYKPFIEAGQIGRIDLIEFLISKYGYINYGEYVYGAASMGNLEIVNYCLSRNSGHYSDNALCGAAHGGHLELVKLFISKGAPGWHGASIQAAHAGHKHVVEYMLSLSQEDWLEYTGKHIMYEMLVHLDCTLGVAVSAGHQDIADLFISKGARLKH